jgi:hypothetical protein
VLPLLNTGKTAKGNDNVSFAKPKNGTSVFKASFTRANFAGTLGSAGLTNGSFISKPVSIVVSIAFNGVIYTKTVTLKYKATQGKSGSAQ